MRTMIFAAALGLTALAGTAPALADRHHHSKLDDGEPISQQWSTTGRFDGVTLAGSDEVTVIRGDRWQIRASGPSEVVADLRFLVEDGDLVVGRRWRRQSLPGTARIEVIAPAVDHAVLAGSGSLAIDAINGEDVDATLAGSGDLDLRRIRADVLKATVAGSGRLHVSGQAADGRITIAGSGDFDGSDLRVGRAKVSVAGSGDARFRADRDVSASIVGSGDVTVTGTTDCKQSRMGSGRLRCSR